MKNQKRILSLIIVLIMVLSTFTALSTNAATTGSQVYFDNSVYKWEQVYVYAYGTKGNGDWPGQLMDFDELSGLYTKSFPAT